VIGVEAVKNFRGSLPFIARNLSVVVLVHQSRSSPLRSVVLKPTSSHLLGRQETVSIRVHFREALGPSPPLLSRNLAVTICIQALIHLMAALPALL
jgi:hypothetical protein